MSVCEVRCLPMARLLPAPTLRTSARPASRAATQNLADFTGTLYPPIGGKACGRRAAEQRDELAPGGHSITSSARASSVGGTSRPSALAVFMLMISSYLVGVCTGKSAGFSPLRMRERESDAERLGSL